MSEPPDDDRSPVRDGKRLSPESRLPPPPPPPLASGRSIWRRWWFWLVLVVSGVAITTVTVFYLSGPSEAEKMAEADPVFDQSVDVVSAVLGERDPTRSLEWEWHREPCHQTGFARTASWTYRTGSDLASAVDDLAAYLTSLEERETPFRFETDGLVLLTWTPRADRFGRTDFYLTAMTEPGTARLRLSATTFRTC